MINIVDIVIGVLLMLYLLKNAGGGIRLVKNFLAVALMLIVFGILAELLLSSPLYFPALKVISESYSFKVSNLIIRVVYPPAKKQCAENR